MRVLHAATFEVARGGKLDQFRAEQSAVTRLGLPWDIRLWSKDEATEPFMRRVPSHYTGLQRRAAFAQGLRREARDYDVLIVRYDTNNPFLLAAGVRGKTWISEHHAIEFLEKAVSGRLRARTLSRFELAIGRHLLRRSHGVIAVTSEILEYQLSRIQSPKPGMVVPNGIDVEAVALSPDGRHGVPKLFCVATRFAPWHGIKQVLAAWEHASKECELHLVGVLDDGLLEAVRSNRRRHSIVVHDFVPSDQLPYLLGCADIGLSAFNSTSTGLTQASRLKVRHYLAMGIPVVGGEEDRSFPSDFPYYECVAALDIDMIVSMAEQWRSASRGTVRSAAEPYVDKSRIVERQYAWLGRVHERAHGA